MDELAALRRAWIRLHGGEAPEPEPVAVKGHEAVNGYAILTMFKRTWPGHQQAGVN